MAVGPADNWSLIIVGASARAAAFSALRAGLRPWCADLFADLDLQARCPAQRLKGKYPHGFAGVIGADRAGPWMFTGGLENWPRLIADWQTRRPLWGIHSESLQWVRDPVCQAHILHSEHLLTPRTVAQPPEDESRRWLLKPRHGAGGLGIREWLPDADIPVRTDFYWQEYIEGQPASVLYAAVRGTVQMLGMTRQLIGIPWLHVAPFKYCGSIGPLLPPPELRHELMAIGKAIGQRGSLAGLFGVDGVLAHGHFWPVEVNPRYTASVEVLEYATGLQAMSWHRRAFDNAAPEPSQPSRACGYVGKAILFAPEDLTFPDDGPWLSELRSPTALNVAPAFADIPAPGERIPCGRPILTFLVHKAKLLSCEDALRAIAEVLTRQLFPNLPPLPATSLQAIDARIVSSEGSPPHYDAQDDNPR